MDQIDYLPPLYQRRDGTHGTGEFILNAGAANAFATAVEKLIQAVPAQLRAGLRNALDDLFAEDSLLDTVRQLVDGGVLLAVPHGSGPAIEMLLSLSLDTFRPHEPPTDDLVYTVRSTDERSSTVRSAVSQTGLAGQVVALFRPGGTLGQPLVTPTLQINEGRMLEQIGGSTLDEHRRLRDYAKPQYFSYDSTLVLILPTDDAGEPVDPVSVKVPAAVGLRFLGENCPKPDTPVVFEADLTGHHVDPDALRHASYVTEAVDASKIRASVAGARHPSGSVRGSRPWPTSGPGRHGGSSW